MLAIIVLPIPGAASLASSLLSTLAILMFEKNKMRVRRCDATEHACVTLSKFGMIGGNVSLCGRTIVSQIRLMKSSAGTLSGGGNATGMEYLLWSQCRRSQKKE